MVNFKAGGHQGEHKRALAAQDEGASHVSKEEKLSMGRDDAAHRQAAVKNAAGLALKVVAREKLLSETNGLCKVALLDADTLRRRGGGGYICRPGGDHVLSARASDAAAPGTILLSEAQRLSLHVCEDEVYEWVPFVVDADTPTLGDLSLEVQLLEPRPEGEPPLEVDASQLAKAAGKLFFEELVSTNELFIARHAGTPVVLRVTDVNMVLDDDDGGGGGGGGITPHCFRGIVTPQTRVYVAPSSSFYAHRGAVDGLALLNASRRPDARPRNCVGVLTSDGEEFPVARQLLRETSCPLELTQGVDCLPLKLTR
mmetsp:Transcript_51938/g.153240  ORF Transcript_51938/g.153240 Transcript_51938/m.153240 type:complete len:313 (+) Transcript_51938:35-973(+)